jgi:hypothetical protein
MFFNATTLILHQLNMFFGIFQVYQLAKLRMLEMEHEFMSKFWPKDNYELVQMDTGKNIKLVTKN